MDSTRSCYPSSQSSEGISSRIAQVRLTAGSSRVERHPCSRMIMGVLRRVLELHEGDKVTGYRQLTMASKAGMDYTRMIRGYDLDTTVLASRH